jgi:hypothetical protein
MSRLCPLGYPMGTHQGRLQVPALLDHRQQLPHHNLRAPARLFQSQKSTSTGLGAILVFYKQRVLRAVYSNLHRA